jgi:hypothetical protein
MTAGRQARIQRLLQAPGYLGGLGKELVHGPQAGREGNVYPTKRS